MSGVVLTSQPPYRATEWTVIESIQTFTPYLIGAIAFLFIMSKLDNAGLLHGEDVQKIKRLKSTKPWSELTPTERLEREMTLDE